MVLNGNTLNTEVMPRKASDYFDTRDGKRLHVYYFAYMSVIIRYFRAKYKPYTIYDFYNLSWCHMKSNLNGYFTRHDFDEHDHMHPWEPKRMKKYIDDGWISWWNKEGYDWRGGEKKMYKVTQLGKKRMESLYNYSCGVEPMPTGWRAQPLNDTRFKKGVSMVNSDKEFRKQIKDGQDD